MQTEPTTTTTTHRPFLQIEGLAKTYPGATEPVFDQVNFTVAKGEFVCIIGHSGCGKTTILNVLAGLEQASAGHVFMDGREVNAPGLERGVVFQGHALMPWLTVRHNIAFAVRSKWPDWTSAQVDAHVQKYVALVGLSGAIDYGHHTFVKPLMGSFAIVDETDETHGPETSTTGICLVPSLEALLWVLRKVGFRDVQVLPVPADGYEQLRYGKRVMVAARR